MYNNNFVAIHVLIHVAPAYTKISVRIQVQKGQHQSQIEQVPEKL